MLANSIAKSINNIRRMIYARWNFLRVMYKILEQGGLLGHARTNGTEAKDSPSKRKNIFLCQTKTDTGWSIGCCCFPLILQHYRPAQTRGKQFFLSSWYFKYQPITIIFRHQLLSINASIQSFRSNNLSTRNLPPVAVLLVQLSLRHMDNNVESRISGDWSELYGVQIPT